MNLWHFWQYLSVKIDTAFSMYNLLNLKYMTYLFKETDPERREFIKDMCEAFKCKVTFEDLNILVTHGLEKGIVVTTYEEWVGANFTRGMIPAKPGQMRIVDDKKSILVDTKQGPEWYSCACFKDDITLESVPEKGELKQILGLPSNNVGYLSTKHRTVLYDSSWKIVELTIEQIAEKFGVDAKSIRIKK